MIDLDKLDFTKGGGLVTVVTQDARTGAVLMVAHADREALEYTLASGEMHYRSRTRGLWHKGATSGNTQRVVELATDCDGDAVLARVSPAGPACHTNAVSCFGDAALSSDAIAALDQRIHERATDPVAASTPPSYTRRLLGDTNLRLKKLGEETAELIAAAATNDVPRATEEAADLVYHVMVALQALGVRYAEVQRVLETRAGAQRGTVPQA